jgi:hypothetical protein
MFVPDFQTDIQDAGYASSLDAVDFAPNAGWSPTGSVELIVGHCYVVWTRDDHYAKFRVTEIRPPAPGVPATVRLTGVPVDPGNRELRATRVKDGHRGSRGRSSGGLGTARRSARCAGPGPWVGGQASALRLRLRIPFRQLSGRYSTASRPPGPMPLRLPWLPLLRSYYDWCADTAFATAGPNIREPWRLSGALRSNPRSAPVRSLSLPAGYLAPRVIAKVATMKPGAARARVSARSSARRGVVMVRINPPGNAASREETAQRRR